MGARSDREAPGADQLAPVADHATAPVREPDSTARPQPGLLAGNAAVARQLRTTDGGSPGLRVALAAPAGNRAVNRALDGGAPAGFLDRVSTAETGEPIPDDTLASLESAFGTPLSGVRLHTGSRSAALAGEVNANAFTIGQDIYFADGQYQPGTPGGYELLAHEVTHTLQQGSGTPATSEATVSQPTDPGEREAESVARRVSAARTAPGPVNGGAAVRLSAVPVMRDVSDWIPDFILDGIRDAISEVPGYRLVTVIVGTDPLTHRPVRAAREELIEELLTFGPFGESVSQVLHAIDVIGDVFTVISTGLSDHNLTLARIEHDIGAAWDELSVTKGIDGNVAIVRRYVDAILADVTAFVHSIVDKVIQLVRSVIATVAEPLLETPEIKPVWDLARKVLHHDPLLGQPVEAPTTEILADFLHLIGKDDVLAQMRERGTLQQTAAWLDTQFAAFAGIATDLGKLFSDAWDAISPENLPNLLHTLPELARRAFALVGRIGEFAGTVIGKVLELVKQSLLGWLSQYAHQTPGYELLTVILGRDVFTGQDVPRTAENLVKGFLCLLPGGETTYEHLAESGVIGEAAAEIEGSMTRLGISWDLVTNTFHGIWDSLSLSDLLAPVAAFERIVGQFEEPISRLVQFATDVVRVAVTLVLKLMDFPTDLLASIIDNALRAIDDIERDPLAFLRNMLLALKNGVTGFLDDILTYLLHGLTSWLFRGLDHIGVTLPPDLSLRSILTLVLDVLGVTAEHLWQKLGEHVGPEKVTRIRGGIDRLSGAWEFVKDVEQGGIAAIWAHVTDQLANLWDTLLGMARDWIMHEIVEKVTAKLLSMLDPTGVMAVVNSFVAFFKAIQSAIEYIRDILKIVNDYVSTFAQVAAGNIAPGAERIKQGLGDAIPIAIGFLANQIGLGNVPEKIVEIIGGLREMIDKAIDWLIEKAVQLGQAALGGLGGKPDDQAAASIEEIRVPFEVAGEQHQIYTDPSGTLMVASDPEPVADLDRLKQLYAQYKALPPTATTGQKEAVIREMIGLIKGDPTLISQLAADKLGDPPNLGDVGPHDSQTQRFQPPSGKAQYAALWELESEHVIPRQFLGSFFDEARSVNPTAMARISNAEYGELVTVLIYKVAADIKTEGVAGDLAQIRQLGTRFGRWIAQMRAEHEPGGPIMDSALDAEYFLQELAKKFQSVVGRTKRAIATEWAGRAPQRGWAPGDAEGQAKLAALQGKVDDAYDRQLPQMVALLDERISDAAE